MSNLELKVEQKVDEKKIEGLVGEKEVTDKQIEGSLALPLSFHSFFEVLLLGHFLNRLVGFRESQTINLDGVNVV